jgi:glucose/arabinose dehydrogenase
MNSFVFLALLGGCDAIRAVVIDNYPQHYTPEVSGGTANAGPSVDRHAWPDDVPRFSTEDSARERVSIHLQPVLTGATQPTEMVFFPGSNTDGFLLEKGGSLKQFNLAQRTLSEVVSIDVLTESEQGLIGAALHPQFLENGRFFSPYV